MDKQKILVLKNINERMENRDKRRKVDDGEDRFAATVADDLKEVPPMERLMAKNEIKNTLFCYQIQILKKRKQYQQQQQQ